MIINEVDQDITVQILRSWLNNHTKTVFTENVDDTILHKIVEENRRHNTELAEPAKSIDTLESLHAYSIDENIPIDGELLNRVFKAATNVDLNINIDVIKANKVLKKRVRGQPLVLKAMDRTLKVMEFDERRGDRPMATILSVGTSGVGKTETAKATAEGTEKDLLIISMTNFNTAESAERFRRHLGSHIRHNSSSVILFDEVEKAHSTVQLSLLPILDEGLVTFFDSGQDGYEQPYTVSLKNTIIFGTSNKGAAIFGKINNYAKQVAENQEQDIDKLTKDIQLMNRQLKPEIRRALERDDFRPELLQRFSSIIPFATLGERVLIDIAEKQIDDMVKYFLSKGYDIRRNPPEYWGDDKYPYNATEIAMYVAIERMINKKDAGGLGARNIRSIILEEIEGEILDAIYEYPGVKKFNLMTDGNCVFEDGDSAQSEGQILVTPFMY
ncbi:AAA family ATPase [Staphylococcus saprophyticus]|nr:AAA family ATPase [Staphylococcus saprophyticus]